MFQFICAYLWALSWDDAMLRRIAKFLARADRLGADNGYGYWKRHPTRSRFVVYFGRLHRFSMKWNYDVRRKFV